MKKIVKILKYRDRHDLAELLNNSTYKLDASGRYGSELYSRLTTVEIYSPIQDYDKLIKIDQDDIEEIINAFLTIYPIKPHDVEINNIKFFVDPMKDIPVKDKLIPDTDIITDYWKDNYYRLFISHHSSIKEYAKLLSDNIINYGISGFVAHEVIEPTRDWQFIIESALISCDCLVAILTNKFHESKWTDQELGIAYGLGKKIISLRSGTDPYGFTGKFQALNANKKNIPTIAHEIFTLLNEDEKINKKIAIGVVEMFINSYNYRNAKDNLKILRQIKYIDEKLIDKLKRSVDSNRQIEESTGVPEDLNAFISKSEEV